MQLLTRYTAGELCFSLAGELDEHASAALRMECDAAIDAHAAATCAVFDLRAVTFMDSTGIGFLIGRYKKCARYSMPVYISAASVQVERILAMSGVYRLIPKLERRKV